MSKRPPSVREEEAPAEESNQCPRAQRFEKMSIAEVMMSIMPWVSRVPVRVGSNGLAFVTEKRQLEKILAQEAFLSKKLSRNG
jgi:hypothetical protein